MKKSKRTFSKQAAASLSFFPGNLMRVFSKAKSACSVRSISRSSDAVVTDRRWETPRGDRNDEDAVKVWVGVRESLVSTARDLLWKFPIK